MSWFWKNSSVSASKPSRPGSVLNQTRKNAAVDKLKLSPAYQKAKSKGLSNNNSMRYAVKMNNWERKRNNMIRGQVGMHQNNRVAEDFEWERFNPRPLLPNTLKNSQQNTYNKMKLAQWEFEQMKRGGGRTHKNRKSRH